MNARRVLRVPDSSPRIGDLRCSAPGLPYTALGSAPAEHASWKSRALAADLAILTQALDEPDADIAATLRHLVVDARRAVRSHLELTVTAGNACCGLSFTTMEDHAARMEVGASLMMPLDRLCPDATGSHVVVIRYAASPDAFVDLAADLSWLARLELDEFGLDQHLPPGRSGHGRCRAGRAFDQRGDRRPRRTRAHPRRGQRRTRRASCRCRPQPIRSGDSAPGQRGNSASACDPEPLMPSLPRGGRP